jgi:hypothetical protein
MGHDRDLLLLLLLLFAFAGMRRGMFGGAWEKRMEQIREKVERDREEQRAFRDLLLAELRQHNATVEHQNALLARIAERLGATEGEGTPPEGAPPEAAAEHSEAAEPRPRRNRKAGSEPAG